MKAIIINKSQIVPIKNIDTVYIDPSDNKKLSIYTVGGFTINNTYDSEESCLNAFKEVYDLIKDYKNGE